MRRTVPLTCAAISCSIFMASSTTTGCPARTTSPSFTASMTTVPCMLPLSGVVPSGPALALALAAGAAAAVGAESKCRRAAPFAAASSSAGVASSSQRVVIFEAGTSACCSSACRKAILVVTPSMRNSDSARCAARVAMAKSATGLWTITLASSES